MSGERVGVPSRPLSVVHVCRVGWPQRGGMEAVVAGLSSALMERGHRVRVVTLARSVNTGEVLAGTHHRGVEYRRVRRVGPKRYPFAAGLIPEIQGFDVCHVHGLDGLADQLVASQHRHGVPVVVSTHGGYFHTARSSIIKEVMLRTVTRKTLRRANAVWYTSEADRDRMRGASAPGVVMTNGHDLGDFVTLGRAPRSGHWLVAGRVAPHKGLEDLVASLAVMPPEARPEAIHFVGRDEHRALPDLLRKAADRGVSGCFAHGEVDRLGLLGWLKQVEVAVFPSRYEGYGLGVLEALAAGVPVVASDIPAHRALLTSPHRGTLVPFDTPRLAAPALQACPWQKFEPEEAREWAAKQDWGERISTFEEGYRVVREEA